MFNSSGEVPHLFVGRKKSQEGCSYFLVTVFDGQGYFKMSFQTVMYSSTLKQRNLQINNVRFVQVNDQKRINIPNHAKLPRRLNNQKVILLSTPRR